MNQAQRKQLLAEISARDEEIRLLTDTLTEVRRLGRDILNITERDILSEGGGVIEVYKKRLADVTNIAYRIRG